jgi:hypothetical protein
MCFIAPHKTRWDETKKSTEVGAQIVIPLPATARPPVTIMGLIPIRQPAWLLQVTSVSHVGIRVGNPSVLVYLAPLRRVPLSIFFPHCIL